MLGKETFFPNSSNYDNNYDIENEPLTNSEALESIDYVLVYLRNSDRNDLIDNFLNNLTVNGLKLTFQYNEAENLVFVLIKIPFEKCLEIAEKIKLKLPIEDIKFKEVPLGNSLTNDHSGFYEEPRDKYTAAYNSKIHYKFEKYFNKTDPHKSFRTRDRILLTYEILSRTQYSIKLDTPNIFSSKQTNCQFGIERLLADKVFLDAYPLHKETIKINSNLTKRKFLLEYWIKPKNWFNFQPIFIIRRYFGEKIAFYFAWLGFYTSLLIVPSIVGIFVFIYGLLTYSSDIPTQEICDYNKMGNITMCPLCSDEALCQTWKLGESCFYSKISQLVDNPSTVFFSIFMSIWTVLFTEFWKRRQAILQFEWDVIDFEKKNEPLRPEFESKVTQTRQNYITGEEELYVPTRTKLYRYTISFSTLLLMMCLVLALVIGFIGYKLIVMAILPKNSDRNLIYWTTLITAGFINLFFIVVLNSFYIWLAVKLNDFELHRTDSRYEKALTIKMYLFQFVNYYASIFYIAFFKGKFSESTFIEKCDQSGCLSELSIQLAIIMVGKQIFNNIQEFLYPLVANCLSRFTANKQTRRKNSMENWLKDYYLISWTNLTLFDEYLEMVIQYGFITLFAVAFPLGPLFALLNNLLEIRIDAFKILTQYKRPLPKKAQDIGIWLPILNTVSKLAVITNGVIIAFTSEFIPRLVYKFSDENPTRSFEGYVNFTLSKTNYTLNGTVCYYRDFRESFDSPNPYQFTKSYYYVLAARLIFLALFEHLVFFIVMFVHWIPDLPKTVQDKIETENLIIQRALWESMPEKTFSKIKSTSSSINRNSITSQEINTVREK
ncbi:unnamed protein product [Brachionus calyciflorus]|uniref:Anoctamin n=1 Tax=Brachionus calyciflorus TaxID=104777 RepID=A0A813SMJ2_9BILA|nr:unnamed protein product [Brachionus calyciflorus]